MKTPKSGDQYKHYDGVIYTVITTTNNPNHFGEKDVHLESSSIPFTIPLKDFYGYKEINGEKVKRFTLVKNLEDKL